MKLDVLFTAAHPDDVELAAAGTIYKLKAEGKAVGIVDLTKGELGTRGTPEIRAKESAKATELMGLDFRTNLDLGDGFFEIQEKELYSLITVIRETKPGTLVINAPSDRHPDHGRAADLAKRAAFMAGLAKIQTIGLEPHRPKTILHYIQNDYIEPSFVIDITPYWQQRVSAVNAFESQFFNPNSNEPETHISSKRFFDFLEARAREMGNKIGVEYAEGFVVSGSLGLNSITDAI